MNIAVPADIETAIAEEAAVQGKPPEDVAVDALRERFVHAAPPSNPPRNLAEFLDGLVGVVSSADVAPGGSHLSENCSEKFTDLLVEERKKGRL